MQPFVTRGPGVRSAALIGSLLALSACKEAPKQGPIEQTGHAAQEVFANGDFEGSTDGQPPPIWTVTPYSNPGVTIQSPQTRAGLNLSAGGSPQTITMFSAAGAESQADAALGTGASLRWPKYGNYVAYINTNGTGTNVNSLKQQMSLAVGDVDPADGKVHIRFAVAPVLQNPGHSIDSQPYYFVQLTNTTRGVILYRDFNASAQPGVPWKTSNGTYYTDWQLVDIAPTSAQAALGDNVELEVIAAGCSAGGHYGRVYVDGVGPTVPGLFVSGTGPASANSGSDVTYTLSYKNGGSGGANNVVVEFNTPPSTVYRAVSAAGASCTEPSIDAAGKLSCSFGNVPAGGGGTFQVTVRIDSGASGTITAGDYAALATGISPLVGPKVFTTITQNVSYADLAITQTNGVAGVAWGQPVTYTIVATNNGPSAVTGATVTDTMPAQLSGVTWTCVGANGGSCAASGSGSINDATVGLPVGATATYTVQGTIVAGSGAGSVANTASIVVPAGFADSDPSNDAAGDTDVIGTLDTVSITKSGAGTVTSVPSAISCGTGCTSASGAFIQGSTVILAATPAPGETFLGWGGACSGTGTCSFTVGGPTAVTVSFSSPVKADGGSCAAGSECQSGNCIDGICCNTTCGGGDPSDCQACNVAGSLGTCTPIAAGSVCRASAGICDVAETCDGASPSCPADAFAAPTTLCRASAGICDVAEMCTGTAAACPADALAPATQTCRASAGPCDVAEQCTGASVACPADGFAPSAQVCRPSAGICDVAEMCTGSAAACPANSFAPPTQMCRASGGICDVAEMCTGAAAACPADSFASTSTVCRASAGICDVAETCTGLGVACPSDVFAPSSLICRASAGICDVAEQCTGSAAACPSDSFAPTTQTCRASAGPCDAAEMCTGSAAACPSDGFAAYGQVCRPSAGVCDVAEVCTGSGVACPPDGFASTLQTCRPAVGPCDVPEACTGLGPACPNDVFASSALICRASAGPCDVAEMCTGSAAACPNDGFAPSSQTCRASAGVCDVAETCTGSAAACPGDSFAPPTQVCRASAGVCDVAETCSGSTPACPGDSFAPSSQTCRPATGPCDVAEACSGSAAACPSNAFAPPGQLCQAATCSSGVASLAAMCSGVSSVCPSQSTKSCGAYVCGASTCLDGCASAADCASGNYCHAGMCLPLTANGGACALDAACGSGHCVDGVCCDYMCDGQCEACDVPGKVGACSPVTGAPHGLRDGCMSDGSNCGGACDGDATDACFYPFAVTCREASCANNTATMSAACDGQGSCPAIEEQPCAPFLCGATACAGDCAMDADCSSGTYCSAGVCVPKRKNGAACSAENQCGAGHCVDGLCCDSACNGQCEACDAAGSEGTCTPVAGTPHGKRPSCATDGTLCGGTCDGMNPTLCAYADASSICRVGSCAEGVATLEVGCNGVGSCPTVQTQDCGTFVCGPKLCLGDCTVDGDCEAASYCSGGVCVEKQAPGATCSGTNQCASGFCVDGVCCDTACNGQCEACDNSAAPGKCSPVAGAPHGAREACKGSPGAMCAGFCDGNEPSACAYPATETTCRPGACANGMATMSATCNGEGQCPDMQQQACVGYACGSDACMGDCESDASCAVGHFCGGGICTPKLLVGASCGGGAQCMDGVCVDGVCCNTACDGQCEACDVPGSMGTCVPVLGSPHGGRGACGGQGTCAGMCDGSHTDACLFPGATTECAAPSCADGVATAAAACDGAGTCTTASKASCDPFACTGTACATTCSTSVDCGLLAVCSAGVCVAFDDVAVPGGGTACNCALIGGDDRMSFAPLLAGFAALLLARKRRRS